VDVFSSTGLGALAALGSACTWAVTSLIVRSLAPTFTSAAINAIRTTVGGAVLLACVLLVSGSDGFLRMSAASFGFLAVSIVLAMTIGDTIFFESAKVLGVARALTVSMTYPLMAAALAAIFLGEVVTSRLLAGAVLTLGGLLLIVTGRAEGTAAPRRLWFGVGAASVAAVAWALSAVLMGPPLQEMDAVTAQAVRLPLAAASLWVTPWARGAVGRLVSSDRSVLVRIAVLSGLTALSSVLFVAGLKYAGVAMATVLSSTAPMFAIPLGYLFLGERLSRRAILGTVLTVAGIAVLRS
jgi:drug/metabolite transporter (DMT)-like permease